MESRSPFGILPILIAPLINKRFLLKEKTLPGAFDWSVATFEVNSAARGQVGERLILAQN